MLAELRDTTSALATARLYAELFSQLTEAGCPPDDAQVKAVDRELSKQGFTLDRDASGKWVVTRSRVTRFSRPMRYVRIGAAWQYAVVRAPAGGINIAGKRFSGGQFIPSKEIAKASPAEQKKLEASEKSASAKAAVRKAAREARGPVDHKELAKRLEPHAGLTDDAKAWAKASYRGLKAYHGAHALHRVEELADLAQAALAKVGDDTPKKRNLRARLAGTLARLHFIASELHGQEKKPEGPKAPPPASNPADAALVQKAMERYANRDTTAKGGGLFGGEDLQARKGFSQLKTGDRVVFTEGENAGKTGKMVFDEQEKRLVATVDGREGEGYVPVDPSSIEPLAAQKSWRTEAATATQTQGGLFGADAFLPKSREGWNEEARNAGHDPAHLHAAADEIRKVDAEFVAEYNETLRKTRDMLGGHGRMLHLERYEDADSVPGLDEAADHWARLGSPLGDSEKLFAALKGGNKKSITRDAAYEQALEHVRVVTEHAKITPDEREEFLDEAERCGYDAGAAEEALGRAEAEGIREGAGCDEGDAFEGEGGDASFDFGFGEGGGDGDAAGVDGAGEDPAEPEADASDPKPGDRVTTPALGDMRDVEFQLFPGDRPGRIGVGYPDQKMAFTFMPEESAADFMADLAGRVNLPTTPSGNPTVDALTAGGGEFLGRGDDGVAFGVGDKVAKLSTTVPFIPTNPGHRTPAEGAARLEKQVRTNNAMIEAGVPGLLRQTLVNHGDRAIAVMDRLDIPKTLTRPQLLQVRNTLDRMHAAGYTLNDDVQAGIGKDGRAYLFDTGKAGKSKHADDLQDDSDRFGRFAEKAGHPEVGPLKAWGERYLQSVKAAEEADFMPPEEIAADRAKVARGLEDSAAAANPASHPEAAHFTGVAANGVRFVDGVAQKSAEEPAAARPASATDPDAARELRELENKYTGPFGPATPQPGIGTPSHAADVARMTELREGMGKQPWQRTRRAVATAMGMPESAHRKQVEQALAAGKPVPPEVLADYPDLAPKPVVPAPRDTPEARAAAIDEYEEKQASDRAKDRAKVEELEAPADSMALPGGNRKTKDGTVWARAPVGGAVSPVNGEHYKGGRWMPIHGLSEKRPVMPKGGEGDAPLPPNPDSRGQKKDPRQPRAPMSPEDVESERMKREAQSQWDDINRGVLGRIKWLGERPNSKAMGDDRTDLKKWQEFASEIGEAKVKRIADALRAATDARIDREIAERNADPTKTPLPPDQAEWEKGEAKRQSDDDARLHGMKKHLAEVPSSLLARQYVQGMLPHAKTVADLHALEKTLAGIVKGGAETPAQANLPTPADDAAALRLGFRRNKFPGRTPGGVVVPANTGYTRKHSITGAWVTHTADEVRDLVAKGNPSLTAPTAKTYHQLADRARASGDMHSERIYRQQAEEVAAKPKPAASAPPPSSKSLAETAADALARFRADPTPANRAAAQDAAVAASRDEQERKRKEREAMPTVAPKPPVQKVEPPAPEPVTAPAPVASPVAQPTPSPEPDPVTQSSPVASLPTPLDAPEPRAAAAAVDAEMKKSEYAFARDSAVPNAGEDLLGSARHKVNAWKSLAEAERDGTAAAMVTRDNLLKNEPPDLTGAAESGNALTALAMHLAMRKFPAEPIGDRYGEYPEFHAAARKWFYDGYRHAKETAERLARTESDPVKALSVFHQVVRDRLVGMKQGLPEFALPGQGEGTRRDRDGKGFRYVALSAYKKFLNGNSPSERVSGALGTAAQLSDFARRFGTSAGKNVVQFAVGTGALGFVTPEDADEYGEKLAGHVLDVLEGSSFNKTFGTVSERGPRFDPAAAYVAVARRVGGPDLGLDSVRKGTEYVLKSLGMRGLQWGQSVTDSEREHHLKVASEAFADLADVLGIDPRDVSLNGKLGLAVGARGHGNASAHYEPDAKVINLTRKKGVGTLAHEWGHFLDNQAAGGAPNAFASEVSGWGPPGASGRPDPGGAGPAMARFRELSNPVVRRMARYFHEDPVGRTAGKDRRAYWLSGCEVFARCFERHVQVKLRGMGRENTYLSGLSDEKTKGGTHPLWPTDDEVATLAPAFDALIEAYRANREQYRRRGRALRYARLAEAARANGDAHSAAIYARQAGALAGN